MDAKVKLALMAPDTFAEYGSAVAEDEPAATAEVGDPRGRVSEVCLGARVETGISTSRTRTWSEGRVFVRQSVYGLVDVTAAAVLETVRTKARSCRTYVATTGKPAREVMADIALPELAGVDGSFGFCQSIPDISDAGFSSCEVFVTHGDLLVAVEVMAGTSEEETQARLPQVLSRAVVSLLNAG